MVRREAVGAHYGLRDWLMQRITAAAVALCLGLLLGILLFKAGMNLAGWHALLDNQPFKLAAYRFIADTSDQALNERLDNLEDPYRLFRCHTITNCVDVCPKGLNPSKAIGKIKEIMVRRAV